MQNTVTVETSELDSIVLTKNGVVVGFVKVKKFNDAMEFVGSPVSTKWGLGLPMIHNSFACSGSILAESLDEISSDVNFLDAMTKAVK
jgi:hypothetical protein